MKRLYFVLLLLPLVLYPAIAFSVLNGDDKQAVVVTTRQNTGPEFLVTVDLRNLRFRFSTLVPDYESASTDAANQRSMFAWKGDYLFVRQQCASLAKWRCVVDQVFTVEGGSLIHLGEVESGTCNAPGCRYDVTDGVFTDLYDGLETNPVSGQVDAPPLRIARRAIGGKLVTDLTRSWRLNQEDYAASIACLEKVTNAGFAEPCANKWNAWSALVFVAKLTHYTGRGAERSMLFDQLAQGYCAKSADANCSKRVAGVKDHYSRFPRGDSPKVMPYPVVLTSVDAPEVNARQPQKFESGKEFKLKL